MKKEDLIKTVKAAQNNENYAIELLFKEFNQQIYYSSLLIVKNEELAKDITQETFITVIRKIGELENPEAFPGWIKKIAHSKCSDFYKKKEVIHETTISTDDDEGFDVFGNIEDNDEDFIPDAALDREDLKKIILDILNKLPEAQRSAIFMRYYDELSVKEIAEIQGVSEGTVMSRLNYGRKAIAKAIEEYEEENEVKLHALPIIPFFHWIFEASKRHATPKIIGSIASGVTEATGVSIYAGTVATGGAIATGGAATTTAAVSGAGFAAKLAAIPLVAKIAVPLVVAATVITPVAVKNTRESKNEEPTTAIHVAELFTSQETTTEWTTTEITTETTVESTTEFTTKEAVNKKESEKVSAVDTTKKAATQSTTKKAKPTQKNTTKKSTEAVDDNYGGNDLPDDMKEETTKKQQQTPGLEMDGTTAAN